MAAPQSWLVCRSPEEWRRWLSENRQRESEVWLKIKKARSVQAGITLSEAVTEAICQGWIDGTMRGLDENSFVLRFTPRKPGSLWSRINRQRAEALIAEGRMTEAGMAAVRAAQASGRWQAAYSAKEKPTKPADLDEALRADPAAARNFDRWTNSEQLQAIVWIEQAKRPETRLGRIGRVVSAARDNRKLSE